MRDHRYRILLLLLFVGLAGCANLAEQQRRDSMVALSSQVRSLESQLAEAERTLQRLSVNQQASREDLAAQISQVNVTLDDLPNEIRSLCAAQAATAAQCENIAETQRVVVSGDKMVVGELERVWIDPPGAILVARVDTGAHSSSVHAENLVEFERDGDDWVRFDLILNDEVTTLERQVVRYVRVYQQADREGTRRPVVSIRLRLGDVQNTFDFTLADRSHLEYQMLLGRNFLADMALVDVGKQFIQPEYRPPQG